MNSQEKWWKQVQKLLTAEITNLSILVNRLQQKKCSGVDTVGTVLMGIPIIAKTCMSLALM
jgi:hypothetical protein